MYIHEVFHCNVCIKCKFTEWHHWKLVQQSPWFFYIKQDFKYFNIFLYFCVSLKCDILSTKNKIPLYKWSQYHKNVQDMYRHTMYKLEFHSSLLLDVYKCIHRLRLFLLWIVWSYIYSKKLKKNFFTAQPYQNPHAAMQQRSHRLYCTPQGIFDCC